MQDQIITRKVQILITPRVTIDPWQYHTIISNIRNCFIEVLNHDADPSVWIVRRWKKFLWFKKRISSDWFINKQQAFAYAYEMQGKYNKQHGIYNVKEKQHNEL